ncbi:MAG: bifunctional cobalt-precorrin 5A hydrolase/precorrin-3B C(17)-methyltransferase, partial [Spongiibacteraceae bacterium]
MSELKSARPVAIVILGNGSADTAQKIQALYAGAQIYGARKRVAAADIFYDDFGATLQALYRSATAIIALCAAGIVIRTLAPLLAEKTVDKEAEPPVLAVAEDGSAVVPLLGGLGGVNVMAREIAAVLNVSPAITTSGELRFGTCLLNPPLGYALADIEQGKRFVSDLLAGQQVRIEGDAAWLDAVALPLDKSAHHTIRVSARKQVEADHELLIHPHTVIAAVAVASDDLVARLKELFAVTNLSPLSLACLVAPLAEMGSSRLLGAAAEWQVPIRFVQDYAASLECLDAHTISSLYHGGAKDNVVLYECKEPVDPTRIGQGRGTLTVIGLGPGAAEFMVPAAKAALVAAEDILGYETYVKMAGPFRADQVLHCTDNREEMLRARHAFELAAQGRRVVLVSSGDPGVFAMASAVLEALHESVDPLWHAIDLQIYPGVSAAFATAARAGAPLGHDFCVLSLSDNLKPWETIEKRLDHAAAGDFVLAFY